MLFQEATKEQCSARVALIGPAGSGKTKTGLQIARRLGKRIAVLDSERRSARKYADEFQFKVLELKSFAPERYIEGIRGAEEEGFDVLLIDSLSHAWAGKDGALEMVDKVAARSRSGNTFDAWRKVTPVHNQLVDAILDCRMHVIATMRTKTEYIVEENAQGKKVPRKIGLSPIQRDGLEYEFDVVADLDLDNTLIVGKTRCSALKDAQFKRAGDDFAKVLLGWLANTAHGPEGAQIANDNKDAATSATGRDDGNDDRKNILDEIARAIHDSKSLEEMKPTGPRATAALRAKLITQEEFQTLSRLFSERRTAFAANSNNSEVA